MTHGAFTPGSQAPFLPHGWFSQDSATGPQSSSATSATLVATSSNDDSAVLRPERAASSGLTSCNASNVVPCATRITRSVATKALSH